MQLNVHAILENSKVNGPGNRYVIWTQGCSKNCEGCFNLEIQPFKGGEEIEVEQLVQDIYDSGCEGVTLSGGDPLEQPKAILELVEALHDNNGQLKDLPLGIIIFTGYTMQEIKKIPESKIILKRVDLLITNRYNNNQKQAHGLAGSGNQKFAFLKKQNRGRNLLGESVFFDQEVEIHYKKDDSSVFEMTGFPNINKDILKSLGLELIEQ